MHKIALGVFNYSAPALVIFMPMAFCMLWPQFHNCQLLLKALTSLCDTKMRKAKYVLKGKSLDSNILLRKIWVLRFYICMKFLNIKNLNVTLLLLYSYVVSALRNGRTDAGYCSDKSSYFITATKKPNLGIWMRSRFHSLDI